MAQVMRCWFRFAPQKYTNDCWLTPRDHSRSTLFRRGAGEYPVVTGPSGNPEEFGGGSGARGASPGRLRNCGCGGGRRWSRQSPTPSRAADARPGHLARAGPGSSLQANYSTARKSWNHCGLRLETRTGPSPMNSGIARRRRFKRIRTVVMLKFRAALDSLAVRPSAMHSSTA